ncbi:MAG: Ig-like domain-containing protein [Mesotoga sp.]|nr:Ig-like domain-containing protein [Mesotoga sp.]
MRKWFFWALLMVVVMVVFAIRLLPDMLNKPPVLNIPDLIIDEGAVLTIDLHDYSSDEKKSLLVFQKISGPGEIKGNLYTFSPTFQQSGKHSVSITASDQSDQIAEETFIIEVREVNRQPTFALPSLTLGKGEMVSINLDDYAKDPDLDTLIYSIEMGGGQIIGSSYTYKPSFSNSREETVSIRVSDGRGGIATSVLKLSDRDFIASIDQQSQRATDTTAQGTAATGTDTQVQTPIATNNPPVVSVPDQRMNQGGTLAIDLKGFVIDKDNDAITIRKVSGPGTLERTLYSYSSPPNDSGQKVVELEVSDGKTTVRSSSKIDVIAQNRSPIAVDIPQNSVVQGQTFSLNLNNYFSDPDGDPLSYQILSGPGNIQNGFFTFQSQTTGLFSTTIRASDGKGGTVDRTVTVNVQASNRPPVISITPRRIAEGEVLTIDLAASSSDPDNDRLSYTLVSGPGTVQGSVYTLRTDFNSAGNYSVVIRVDDGKGGNTTGSFAVEVRDVNRPPLLELSGITVPEGSTYVVDLSKVSSDPDGDALTYSIVQGIGRIENNNYIVEPDYDDYGFYTVVIRASDGKGGQVSSTFDLLVADTNRAPLFTIPDQTTMSTRTLRLDLREFSSDPDGDYLRYELVYGPGLLTGSIYSFTPEGLGTSTVMLKASDLKGGETTTTFTITVR